MWEPITAAIVSVIVSTAVTLWLRRSDQPKSDWIFARLTMSGTLRDATHLSIKNGRPPDFMATATNAGDGAAYKVGVRGVEADTSLFIKDSGDARGFRVPEHVAIVRPGEEVGVLIWFHPVHDKNKVAFRLEWTASPVRRMRTEQREVLLKDPEPQPRPDRIYRRLLQWGRSVPKAWRERWNHRFGREQRPE